MATATRTKQNATTDAPAEVPADTTPAPTKRRKTTAPPLDFNAVTVEDAPQPVKSNAVGETENPAIAWFNSSLVKREHLANGSWRGVGKKVVVPVANATQVETLLRKAARTLSARSGENYGVAIQRVDLGGDRVEIRYAAKNAKQYTKRTTPTA
jgi:hypothetical protein